MTDTMMDAFSYTPPTPSFPTSSSYIPRTPGQRTYAIGDVHGDLTKLVMALVKAGLVEQKVREGEDKENGKEGKGKGGEGKEGGNECSSNYRA